LVRLTPIGILSVSAAAALLSCGDDEQAGSQSCETDCLRGVSLCEGPLKVTGDDVATVQKDCVDTCHSIAQGDVQGAKIALYCIQRAGTCEEARACSGIGQTLGTGGITGTGGVRGTGGFSTGGFGYGGYSTGGFYSTGGSPNTGGDFASGGFGGTGGDLGT